jgi:hypothetical protein
MNDMLIGAITCCSLIVALFFLKFWRSTHDRFFLFFAISFFIEAVNRASLSVFNMQEGSPAYYLIRWISYGFIIYAIVEKNRRARN